MSRYNEILVGRYNRFLQKLLQMKGGPPAAQLSGDIQAALNLFNGIENRYLEGWQRFGSTGWFTAATPLFVNGVSLRNPAGSNVIAVVEKLAIAVSVAGEVDVSLGKTVLDMTTIVGSSALDSRHGGAAVCVVSQGVDSPGSVNIIGRVRLGSAAIAPYEYIVDENQEIALLPGQGFRVVNTIANSELVAVGHWRERFLEESERT